MRRIIPYIASNFQNDRIWLRRAKPSKREYQILIAVDDSSSMTENNCNQVRSLFVDTASGKMNTNESWLGRLCQCVWVVLLHDTDG